MVLLRNCTNKKVPVVPVKVTCVTLCIKVVVPFLDQNHMCMILN